jgi:septal ring factor EnvC (AmiA/AmiB activator)
MSVDLKTCLKVAAGAAVIVGGVVLANQLSNKLKEIATVIKETATQLQDARELNQKLQKQVQQHEQDAKVLGAYVNSLGETFNS